MSSNQSPLSALLAFVNQLQWDHGLSDKDIAALLRGVAVDLETKKR